MIPTRVRVLAPLALASVLLLALAGVAAANSGGTPPPAATCGPPTTPPSSPTRTPRPSPTTTAPPTATVPPAPPAGGGTTAAAARGWGPVVGGDEFNYTGAPNSRWGVYDGPGHAGNGRRTPSAFSVSGGALRVHGDAKGNTGGMAYDGGQYRGRWEARMRVPRGDSDYHPVLLLWPDAEDFPTGGEVDYAEATSASSKVDFFLHYGASNSQTHGSKTLDLTQWHNYAVEWTSSCVIGYVDNQEFFRDCNASHLPPRKMHATIQLDGFHGSGPYTPTDMYVDWIRQFAP